jgi:hypothetical protein
MRITIFEGVIMRTRMISLFHKRTILSVAITLFLILSPRLIFGQTSINHTINFTVNPVSIIQINGGTITLNITGANAIAGVDQMSSAPNESSTLIWGTNSTPRKITIRTNLTPQLFTLKAEALNPTVGTTAGEVTLSTAAYDYNFITNIGTSTGSATVRYTGVALASKGTGTDSHTITFTITP